MSDFLKDFAKSALTKMNLFVVLQIVWIIEFHILAIFSAKDFIYSMTGDKVKEPPLIAEYSKVISNWMDAYNEFILFVGIILIVVGISGAFFKLIPVLNSYKIIYIYSDFGVYAGCWFILMFCTYDIYVRMGKAFLAAPIVVYIFYCFIKKIKEWLETKGITFAK